MFKMKRMRGNGQCNNVFTSTTVAYYSRSMLDKTLRLNVLALQLLVKCEDNPREITCIYFNAKYRSILNDIVEYLLWRI